MDETMQVPGPRRLRPLAVWLPIAAVVLLQPVRDFVLRPRLGAPLAADVTGLVTVLGVIVFSLSIWRLAERAEAEMIQAVESARARERQLVALHEAALNVTSALDLPTVLRRVVEASRGVIGTKYGALAVLDAKGGIEAFVTSGLDEETTRRLSGEPAGHGLLGLVISEHRALRLNEIAEHPAAGGFPPGHPVMRRLLAVPLFFQGAVLGSLYLADPQDGEPFDAEDQQALERFAAQAAIAVGNARLYGQIHRLSLVEERERIGMDLHDGVLQALYATGLGLEAVLDDVERDPPEARQAIERAIDRLHSTIGDIRHYVFDLRRSQMAEPGGLAASLRQLVDGLQQPGVAIAFDAAPLPAEPSKRVQWECWHITREAVSNALRHGQCGKVTISLRSEGERLLLRVADDGRGFAEPPTDPSHRGLRNMRRRAEVIGGHLDVDSAPGRGTVVSLSVPLNAEGGAT